MRCKVYCNVKHIYKDNKGARFSKLAKKQHIVPLLNVYYLYMYIIFNRNLSEMYLPQSGICVSASSLPWTPAVQLVQAGNDV